MDKFERAANVLRISEETLLAALEIAWRHTQEAYTVGITLDEELDLEPDEIEKVAWELENLMNPDDNEDGVDETGRCTGCRDCRCNSSLPLIEVGDSVEIIEKHPAFDKVKERIEKEERDD